MLADVRHKHVSKMTFPSVKKAFLIHFGISLFIFIILAALMRLVWYPDDLFWMDGGWQGLQIIAPIDLVLGPALTLCFYRPWKKNLVFDMAVIATVQIAALGYGVYAAYNQRPAALVFAENRFETLSFKEYKAATDDLRANDIEPRSLREFGSGMPMVVHARPYGKEDYGQYLADVMNGLPELRERSDRYRAIADARAEIAEFRTQSQQHGTGIAMTDDAGVVIEIPASSQTAGTKEKSAAENPPETYTLKARYEDGTIEFHPETFEWTRITRDPK